MCTVRSILIGCPKLFQGHVTDSQDRKNGWISSKDTVALDTEFDNYYQVHI